MRPDKPGYWWYLPIRGEAKIAYLAKGYAPYLCVVEEKIIDIHQFESQSNFKQWLGPAYPPKLESATVHEMVSQWIARNGADGLWNEEGPCGCDGSAPCGDGPYPKCKAAVAVDEDGNGVDFLYYPVTILPYWDSND